MSGFVGRALFLPRYGPRAGSSRYMTYDYIADFERAGIRCSVSPLLDDVYLARSGRLRSRPDRILELGPHVFIRVLIRVLKVFFAWRYDVVVFEKDLIPYAPYALEALLFLFNPNTIVMYDEATYILYDRHPNRLVRWAVKGKIDRIARTSRQVVVLNEEIGRYFLGLNACVSAVPTGIDLDRYRPKDSYRVKGRPFRIGWIGSPSGHRYLRDLDPVLARLARENEIVLVVIGSDPYAAKGYPVENVPWSVATEAESLRSLDAGLMPLRDDVWSAGKSGCKMFQYMAAGLPVVVSPVGITRTVVRDGENGFLAETAADWERRLSELIRDEGLRRRLGEAGRRYIEARHSRTAMAGRLLDVLRGATGPGQAGPVKVAVVAAVDLSLRYLLLGQIKALRDARYDVTGISSQGPGTAALAAEGIRHLPVRITRRITPGKDVLALLRLRRIFRRERFSIVHTHTPKAAFIGQWAARLAGVPVIVNTVHGFYFHDGMPRAKKRVFILLERFAARCSDLILSQSREDVVAAVRERICSPGRIRFLGNGIDLGRFDPARVSEQAVARLRGELGIPASSPVVGYVGRLARAKGLPDLLAAAGRLRTKRGDVRYLVVGPVDAAKSDAVRPEAARTAGVDDIVVFTGLRQDMPALYALMDIFVLPSRREGMPRAAIEAAAMGVPSVLTDIRGCREVVADGRSGILVPPGDVGALAGAIEALLGDRVKAGRMGAEGRMIALERFDEDRVSEIVVSEYERLLRLKGRRKGDCA